MVSWPDRLPCRLRAYKQHSPSVFTMAHQVFPKLPELGGGIYRIPSPALDFLGLINLRINKICAILLLHLRGEHDKDVRHRALILNEAPFLHPSKFPTALSVWFKSIEKIFLEIGVHCKLSPDCARIQQNRRDATAAQPYRQLHREERVCRLGLAVCGTLAIGLAAVKSEVFKAYQSKPVPWAAELTTRAPGPAARTLGMVSLVPCE